MKVLMIGRNTLFRTPGGDTVQIRKTAEHLQKLGVDVTIELSGQQIDYKKYDLVHFFNIIRPDDILPHIEKSPLPFVVSTIYVDYSEYETRNRQGVLKLATSLLDADQLEYFKAIARFVKNGDRINSRHYLLNGHRRSVQHIARKASMLLPNSHSEYRRFQNNYHIDRPYRSIPNAIDTEVFHEGVPPNEQFRNHVLCVGRFEGLKNQLNLIRALMGTEAHLTLVGKPSPNHLDYYEACRQLVAQSPNMQIIEHMGHGELAGMYQAAKVHVLPSWFETTGLSSLEAGALGCNVVVTRKGDTEEYFGDLAYYCEPDDVASIKEAVLKAWREPVRRELQEKIRTQYTWQITARETLTAYQTVLNS